MLTTLREIGKSKGAIIPAAILKQVGYQLGDKMNIEITESGLLFTLVKEKHTLDKRIAMCDLNAPLVNTTDDGEQLNSVGAEI